MSSENILKRLGRAEQRKAIAKIDFPYFHTGKMVGEQFRRENTDVDGELCALLSLLSLCIRMNSIACIIHDCDNNWGVIFQKGVGVYIIEFEANFDGIALMMLNYIPQWRKILENRFNSFLKNWSENTCSIQKVLFPSLPDDIVK